MRSHSLGSWLVHDPNAVRLWVTLQQLQLNRVGSVVSPAWSTVTQQRQLDGEGTRRSYIRQCWIVLYGIKTDHAPDLDQSQKFNHPRSILLINYLQICLTFWDITCTDTAVIPSSVADIITCMTSWITIHYHIYADDKQIYEYDDVCISEIDVSLQRLNDCVSEVGDLCASRQLQLNISKTELAWFGSRTNMQQEGWLSPTERASVSAHFGLHRVCLWNNRGKFT